MNLIIINDDQELLINYAHTKTHIIPLPARRLAGKEKVQYPGALAGVPQSPPSAFSQYLSGGSCISRFATHGISTST